MPIEQTRFESHSKVMIFKDLGSSWSATRRGARGTSLVHKNEKLDLNKEFALHRDWMQREVKVGLLPWSHSVRVKNEKSNTTKYWGYEASKLAI